MNRNLQFGLLRISICQILKATGFEKISPTILDIITDIYIRYLSKLLKHSLELSQHNNRGDCIQVQDVTQTMVDIGFVKPVRVLDPFDLDPLNHDCLLFLKEYVTSKRHSQFIKINKIDKDFLIKDTNTKNKSNLNIPPIEDKNEEINVKDWIHYLILKKIKLGKELTFNNTDLASYADPELVGADINNPSVTTPNPNAKRQNNDFIISGPEIPQQLIECLPYNQNLDFWDENEVYIPPALADTMDNEEMDDDMDHMANSNSLLMF